MNIEEGEKPHVLVIDDEPAITELLCNLLKENYKCTSAKSAEEAFSVLGRERVNLVLSDINMNGMSGIELIPRVLVASPDTVVMIISGEQTVETAIDAMRVGAFDYITKPFDLEHVEFAVYRALEHQALLEEKRHHETNLEQIIEQRTAQLDYLALHDALTELPNRTLFEDRLSQAIVAAERNRESLAIVWSCLDRFKKIQDTLGRDVGSCLLQAVAERLKNCLPENTTIAKIDGDEFAILLTQIEGTETVVEVTEEINETLKLPFLIDEQEVFITASSGISFFPNDGADASTLSKNACIALDRAKEQGGNNYQFYTAEMNAEALKRITLENNLRRALEREEFEVFYQPKVNVKNGQIGGMEALVRWRHPELGLVSPSEFIPLAEDTGLIEQLGEWILRTACYQCSEWQKNGAKPFYISVNLSPRQFQQPNLLKVITDIIQKTGVDSDCLVLELTESSIMKNAESAIETLSELKKMGIKIAIDDFGTGYSSLGYLKRLPIDILKIDRSFVCDVTTDADDAALVMAIITLAHNLGLKVIAEGVETEEQLRFLRLLRCDDWQGYLSSEPMPAANMSRFLTKAMAA
jgi:diguanylate cyclase (GGDEF)-like protein